MKASEKLNEILDRAFAEPEQTFSRRFCQKIGFKLTQDDEAKLTELWAIVENANEQQKRFSLGAADEHYKALAAEQVANIDAGRPIELVPDRGIHHFQFQSACSTAMSGRNRALKHLRNFVRPIAQRFAEQLRREALAVDAEARSRAEDYGMQFKPTDVAEHLRAEADAVERQADTGETPHALLPWVI